MSCKEYEIDLLCHADGELQGEDSLRLLAHLKVCPSCSAQHLAQQQMRATIARVMSEISAPTSLAAAIVSVLEADVQSRPQDAKETPAWQLPRILKLYGPTALAAMIAIAAAGLWLFGPSHKSGAQYTSIHAVDVTDDGPVAIELAKNLYGLHVHCATLGAGHQDPNLPHDAAEAARQLEQSIGLPVLTGNQLRLANGKTQFDSAHLCRFKDASEQEHSAAHLIYRGDAGEALSLLSMKTFDEITSLKTRVVADRTYAVLEPGVSTKCHPFTIVAWSSKDATYMVCSPFGYTETMESVEPLRVALESGSSLPGLLIASIDP
jgi:hypothetical protein